MSYLMYGTDGRIVFRREPNIKKKFNKKKWKHVKRIKKRSKQINRNK